MSETVDRPIARTARIAAAYRARESARPDALFHDPLAGPLAGELGIALLDELERHAPAKLSLPHIPVRTAFFDRFLTTTVAAGPARQIVLPAAGMDTRAFRLDWPEHTVLYELDLPELLQEKELLLSEHGTAPRCTRRSIAVDLEHDNWAEQLHHGGFQPEQPTVWLIEGLLQYLTEEQVRGMLTEIHRISAPGSRLGLDVISQQALHHTQLLPMWRAVAESGAPMRFGSDKPEVFLADLGWQAQATRLGSAGADFGRGRDVTQSTNSIPAAYYLVEADVCLSP